MGVIFIAHAEDEEFAEGVGEVVLALLICRNLFRPRRGLLSRGATTRLSEKGAPPAIIGGFSNSASIVSDVSTRRTRNVLSDDG